MKLYAFLSAGVIAAVAAVTPVAPAAAQHARVVEQSRTTVVHNAPGRWHTRRVCTTVRVHGHRERRCRTVRTR